MKKAQEKQQKKFVKKLSDGLKLNKNLAYEADYDYYFKNN